MGNMTFEEFASHIWRQLESDPSLRHLPMYMSTDAEGNNYRPFSGDFDIDALYYVDDRVPETQNAKRCIVFYPN